MSRQSIHPMVLLEDLIKSFPTGKPRLGFLGLIMSNIVKPKLGMDQHHQLPAVALYVAATEAILANDRDCFSLVMQAAGVTLDAHIDTVPRSTYPALRDYLRSHPSLLHVALTCSRVSFAYDILQRMFDKREQRSQDFTSFAIAQIRQLIFGHDVHLGGAQQQGLVDVISLAIMCNVVAETIDYIVEVHADQSVRKLARSARALGIKLTSQTISGIQHDASTSVASLPDYDRQAMLQRAFVRLISVGEIEAVRKVLTFSNLYQGTIPPKHTDPYLAAVVCEQPEVLALLLDKCPINPNRHVSEPADADGDRKIDELCSCLSYVCQRGDSDSLKVLLGSNRIELQRVQHEYDQLSDIARSSTLTNSQQYVYEHLQDYITSRNRELKPAVSQIQQFWRCKHPMQMADDGVDESEVHQHHIR